MNDKTRALNSLREQRRLYQLAVEKARKNKNQIDEQRAKREVRRVDAEIANLS